MTINFIDQGERPPSLPSKSLSQDDLYPVARITTSAFISRPSLSTIERPSAP